MAAAAIAALGTVGASSDRYLRQLARSVQAEAAREAAELQGVRQDVCDVLTSNAAKATEALLRAAQECEDTADRLDAAADAATQSAEELVAAEASRCVERLRAAHRKAQAGGGDEADAHGLLATAKSLALDALRAAVPATGVKAAHEAALLCAQASERIKDLATRHGVHLGQGGHTSHGLGALEL